MKRKEKLLCLCATLVAVTAFGGIPKWISGDTKSPDKPAPIVYRDFRLDSMPSHAEMTMAVAGWHELNVNGRRVGDEVLSPVTCQPNLRHSSVTRDITNLLRVGRDKQILLAAAFAMGVL